MYDYRINMLERNRIQGLLQAVYEESRGGKQVVYDISSKECLKHVIESGRADIDMLEKLLYGLERTLKTIETYLLPAEDLLLLPEYIYLSDTGPYFVLLPGSGRNMYDDLSGLLKELIGGMEHGDEEGVAIAYELYRESLRPNYVISDVIRIIEKKRHPESEEAPEIMMLEALSGDDGMLLPDNGYVSDNNSGISEDPAELLRQKLIPKKAAEEKKERHTGPSGLLSSITALLTDRQSGIRFIDRT